MGGGTAALKTASNPGQKMTFVRWKSSDKRASEGSTSRKRGFIQLETLTAAQRRGSRRVVISQVVAIMELDVEMSSGHNDGMVKDKRGIKGRRGRLQTTGLFTV